MYSRIQYFLCLAVSISAISSQNNDAENPVDLTAAKHIQISNFNGELTAEMMRLFKNLEILELRQSNFTPLHYNILHVLPNVKKIMISNSYLTRVEENIEKCCKKLKEIELVNSGFPDFPWDRISHGWPLERVYLHKEKVPKIESNILVDKKLKELTIEFSGTETIDDGAFNKVNHLESLSLEGNKIKKITKELLAPLKSLKVLNLRRNLLEEFTTEQIPELPNLEKINIGHNPIKKFNLEGVKKQAPKLNLIDVSEIDDSVIGDTSKIDGVNFLKTRID